MLNLNGYASEMEFGILQYTEYILPGGFWRLINFADFAGESSQLN